MVRITTIRAACIHFRGIEFTLGQQTFNITAGHSNYGTRLLVRDRLDMQ